MLVFFSLTNFFSVGKPSQKYSKSKKSHRKTIKAINTSVNHRRTIFFCFFFSQFALSSTANNSMQSGYSLQKDTFINNSTCKLSLRLRHRFRACGPCRCKSWMNHYARGLSSPTWDNIFGHFVSLQSEKRSRVDFWKSCPISRSISRSISR